MNSQIKKGPEMALLFMALCAAMSCAPARIITETQRDSVVVYVRDSVIVHDTIIKVPVPPEADRAILPDTDTSRLQTCLAESEAFVKNGRLHHSLRNRPERVLPVRVQYVDRARSETRTQLESRQTVETIEVEKELSRWQKFIMALGWAALVAGATWLALKIRRFIK